jgi:hypothetical protein
MIKNPIFALLSLFLLLQACEEDDSLTCSNDAGLSGTLFNETALRDFVVCGEFKLAPNPDIIANLAGQNRIIGQHYEFEELDGIIESVYYIKGSLRIWRKDSTDYQTSAFNFTYSHPGLPREFLFEDDDVYVALIFSKDSGNPSHQGPTQYIDWQDYEIEFSKPAHSDQLTGRFKTRRGRFWIPGPASDSWAGLDLQFRL